MHGTDRNSLIKLAIAKKRLAAIEEAKIYEDSLYKFIEAGWRHIDPAPFVGGWHLECIAEHLEAVTNGHIKRLLINIPPRMSKSSTFSVAWPAWTWAQKRQAGKPLLGPEAQFLFASYAESLSVRDSIKTRRMIMSPWYQRLWKDRYALTGDQNTKIRFENTEGGYRLSTSVGGTLTGEGGSILGIDDAHKADEVESEVVRKGVLDWYDEVFSTRLNDPKMGAIVVIGQRVHEEDISGHLLEMGKFVHICVPMEYENVRHVNGWVKDSNGIRIESIIGEKADLVEPENVFWQDPRTEEGALLCDGRYGPEEIDEQKRKPYVWAGQFQQRPAPKGGSIIKEEYWKLWDGDKYPPFEYLLASVDTAYTEKQENDPSALTIWGLFRDEAKNPRIMLVYAWQGRLEFNALCQKLIDICVLDGRKLNHPRFPVDRIIIEPKASGMSVAQELHRIVGFNGRIAVELANMNKKGGGHTPDKVARVHSIQHLFTDGMIWAPDRTFADMVIKQCGVFPKGSHDDLVDTVSMALRYLRDAGFALSREEYSHEVVEQLMLRPRQGALYPV